MLLYVVCCLVCALAILRGWRGLYPKPYVGIPYNTTSTSRVLGDIPELVSAIRIREGFPDAILSISTRRLGKPIAQVLFPVFRKPLIVVDDPREVEDILWRRQVEFDVAQTTLDLLAPMIPYGMFSQFTTPQLKAQKRLWVDVARVSFLHRAIASPIHDAARDLVELWQVRQKKNYSVQPFNVLEDLKNAALDMLWTSVVGDRPGVTRFEINKLLGRGIETHEKAPFCTLLKREAVYLSEVVARHAKSPFPKWAQRFETWTPRYRKFRATVGDEVLRIIKTSSKRLRHLQVEILENDHSTASFLDMALRRWTLEAGKAGEPSQDPTKDQLLVDQVFGMLFAGGDSIAYTLSWFVKFMEAYPGSQHKLRKELRAAFTTRSPSAEDIIKSQIPYLDATCEELFRLAGTSTSNLRQALVDTEILGCKVPKGAEILLNFHVERTPFPIDESIRSKSSQTAAARREDGFFNDANQDVGMFEPRRWLASDQLAGKETFKPYAIPRLGFGAATGGVLVKRPHPFLLILSSCHVLRLILLSLSVGRNLATMEVRIFIVLLILNFEFLALPEELRGMGGIDNMLRRPNMPFAKIRVLTQTAES
ncbi:cytochrome P450 [Xylaria sp. FL1042]|nr:cytochrome P450 [Xylaria sp. FL1042]